MSPLLRTLFVPSLLVLSAGAVAFLALNHETTSAASAAGLADQPLTSSQVHLLELAFQTASSMPPQPHVKTRCRLQQDVVDACLALDAPKRALDCAQKISDWRRGLAHAECAYYAASHGAEGDVPRCLAIAHEVAAQGEPTITQDWQKGRIQVAIAKTHAWLGHTSEAAALETDLDRSETGKVDAVRALRADPAAFDEQLAALRAVLAGGDFDLSKNALATCARLFERYYDDAERRARVLEAVDSCGTKIPLDVRIDVRLELATAALAHQDQRQALELVEKARAILGEAAWLPENFIPLAARIAALRFRAGEKEEARLELHEALTRYERERATIVDIYRAGALRPIAEAYHAMGDEAAARATYARTIEEGTANPNSRPRAEDLVSTCLSMARNGIEMDTDLKEKLEKVFAGLGAPW